jgi:catechol 2,3-dioxygenase-like lactoylglutathione lyase family enzyme
MDTNDLATVEIKAFVPARDMDDSLAFYRALGFQVPWSSPDLAYVHHGDSAFLLQLFSAPGHAENFMMHLLVKDADAWWQHVQASGVLAMPGVRGAPPEDRPWRLRDFTLVDPGGVLWRIGHNIASPG